MEVLEKMKANVKFLCLMLSLLMLIACFASRGNGDDETTLSASDVGTEDEAGRDAVKDNVPTDLNFKGESVTFFVRDDRVLTAVEMDVENTTNDTLNDAVYYRNTTVEDRLGIEIKEIGLPNPSGSSEAWHSTIRNTVLTKSGDIDVAAINSSTSTALAVEGMYYNLLNLPHIDFEKPWWNQSIKDELTLFDTLYFIGGDIAVTQVARSYGMFYNKDLLEEFYKAKNLNLYDVVRQGKWTVEYMGDLVSGVWIDENNDGIISDGDTVGYACNAVGTDGTMDAWIPAMDIKITTMVDGYPELTFYNEHSIAAFEKLKALHIDNPGSLSLKTFTETGFALGNQLFARQELDSGSLFREMTDDYGILPLPKFDEEQGDYHTLASSSLMAVLSTCQNPEKLGATLELMSAEGYKQITPAYFEVCLKGKYSDAPDDAEMYDRIINGILFNFGNSYSKSIGSISPLFRNLTTDFAQVYEANKVKYETSLETLINKLDEIAIATE